GDHSAYDPDIAVSKDWVYVVWADDRNLIRDLFFKRGYIGVGVEEGEEQRVSIKAFPTIFTDRVLLNGRGSGSLLVYDASGRRLVKLWEGEGAFSVTWDGKDRYGHRLPNGIYFIVLKGNQVRSKKVIKVTGRK
ncbi:hypothetical protein DRP53_09390, partial [candidate division WOR-3 bacterium]